MTNPIPEAPPHINREGFVVISPQEAKRRLLARTASPAPAAHPLVVLKIVDAAAVSELDPLVRDGDICRLWGISEATVISKDGVEILRVTPAEPGAKPNLDVPLELYEAIVESAGLDPIPTDSAGVWGERGQSEAREVMRDPPPTTGIAQFRRPYEARVRMAEAEAAHYGASPEQIAQVTGREYVARKSLRPTGEKAQALSREASEQRAQAEREEAEAAARIEEATVPNRATLEALGLTGIALPDDGLTQTPRGLAGRMVWDCGEESVVVWPSLAEFGLGLPPGAQCAGFRVLDPSFVHPAPAPVLQAEASKPVTNDVFSFTEIVRKRLMPDVHRGPIAKDQWSKAGVGAARALAAKHAELVYRPRGGVGWGARALLEAFVRGLLTAPPIAVAILHDALSEIHVNGQRAPVLPKSRRPAGTTDAWAPLLPVGTRPVGIQPAGMEADPDWRPTPYPLDPQLGEWAAACAQSGSVEAGSLLPKATESKKRR